jgi:putative ABC transport system permease protein
MRLDLLWAFRWLRKNPFFAMAVVFVLALGIGANTAVFSIVDAVLLRPSPYPSAESLVRIEESSARRSFSGVPVKDYQRWADRSDVFEKMAPYIRDTVTLTGDGEPEQVIAVRSLRLFSVLGVPARLGRTLVRSDDEEGPQNVAVLSDRLWRRRYHGDPRVIGRAITVSGDAYVIVGVMPPDFEFHYSEAELWTPLRLTPASPWLQVAARLHRGVSVTQARSALGIVAHQMEQEDPQDHVGLKIVVTTWRDTRTRNTS